MSSQLGGTVVLTREPHENAALASDLALRGCEVIEVPCVTTAPVPDPGPISDAIRALAPHDRLVVTSPRGAKAVVDAVGAELRAPVTAIGDATAFPLLRAGIAVDTARASSGRELAATMPLPRGRVLLARGDRALPDLPQGLRARGATVNEIIVYRTVVGASGDVERARVQLRMRFIAVVVFASPSAVDAFLDAIPWTEAGAARAVAIGPTTAARLRERTGVEAGVAAAPTDEALLDAIVKELRVVSRA